MEFSVERLWQMPQMQLLATYHEVRRLLDLDEIGLEDRD